ncbi:hypothetical protein KAR91_15630 [Candidatus Pacearchaeota archaeon]|nr:hypothetical protein [Candidatus Pacearchaeota archaeon]
MEKKVIARKDHECCWCDVPILAGDEYFLKTTRAPRYGDGEYPDQIGIEYVTLRMHLKHMFGRYKLD